MKNKYSNKKNETMTQNMLKSRATLCDTKLLMVLAPLQAVHKLDITELLMTMQLL